MAGNTEYDGHRRGNRLRLAAWAAAGVLLLLPWLAMQVTDQVAWSMADFALLGAFLGGGGVILELVARKTRNTAYRTAAGIALAAVILLVGITGAVGIIGTANDDANLMYGGVIAVGMIGILIARFRPGGMAHALYATAFAQVLVAVIALVAGLGSSAPNWPLDVLGLTAIFTAMWILSARLFRRAAREP